MMARLLILAGLLLASAVEAQDYQYGGDDVISAAVIDQPKPEFPGNRVRRGQEGWVRMHFIIDADGHAVEPIVIDSVGGGAFEHEARVVLDDWRFEAPASGDELPDNLVNIRSEIEGGRDAASSNFMRRYRSIMMNVFGAEVEEARKRVDDAHAIGGWNLYESTMLWLMTGRIEGAEGNPAGKLEAYQRALRISNARSLARKPRREALVKIFELQHQLGHFAHATSTFEILATESPDSEEFAATEQRAAAIAALMQSEKTLSARATTYKPCNCDTGEALWYYQPQRRTFSFAGISGSVNRFEARCESGRVSGDIVDGKLWTLPPDWGSCHLFVFGDEGASFDFLGHLVEGPDEGRITDAAANDVARHHVLD